uniref:NADH dehydrogenase subunit 6 n=1 Tax=Cordulegaster boltonii TaxID=126173 RepID=UPI002028DF4B|nr:NADH dehydrogenase subunit 6 [Cordulegaster boltonii]UPL65120.1 NADH dehydrogenase subunit 6 [Cordulegaster boltonii]
MSQFIYLILASLNSMFFSKMNHPMNMGILLLLQTMIMCLLTGSFSQNTWFSYVLFLVFLGGMLVLFIYMTSIASNELFQSSNYIFIIMISTTILFLTIFIYFFLDNYISLNNTNESLSLLNMFKMNEKYLLANLYNMPNSIMTIFMVLYLFLTLIVVVIITKSYRGPLRPMN